jgi:mono/diheme cytochrome c family protein
MNGLTLARIQGRLRKRGVQRLAGIALCCATIATFGLPSGAVPQGPMPEQEQPLPPLIRSTNGPDLFRAYCASCHGMDAKGNGPAAVALKAKVPDLTVLAKNNLGQFPDVRVRRAIMGDDVIAAHGSREMPIWGPIFHQIEEDVDRGNVRLDNLVKYLRSIQSLK